MSKGKQDLSGLWCLWEQIMNTIQSGYTVNNTGSPCLIKRSKLSLGMLVLVKLHEHHFLVKHEGLHGH